MTVGGEGKSKIIFETAKSNLRDVTMKYGRLIVFILHESAEIWWFKYGLKLFISTLKL